MLGRARPAWNFVQGEAAPILAGNAMKARPRLPRQKFPIELGGRVLYVRQPMRWSTAAVVCALCLSFAASALADVYVYVDRNGVPTYTNAPSHAGSRFFMSDYTYVPSSFVRADPARARRYDPIIRAAARRHQVDPALVKAVIRAESDFVPVACSPKGAQGLMQLMPGTARLHEVRRVYDPAENVEGGVRHLRLLLDRYNGNIRLALAAYNAGSAAVDRNGGVPPFPETQEYLRRVLRFRDYYARQGG